VHRRLGGMHCGLGVLHRRFDCVQAPNCLKW
jgi:hypothetical protein